MNSAEKIKDLQSLVIKNKRRIWKPYMEKYHCDIIAELGVCTGVNFKFMIESNPKLAVAVDAWIEDGTVSRNDSAFTQEVLDSQYDTFKKEMEAFPFVNICREYTFDAANRFPDNYFDLVYVDADHTYDGCMRDLVSWWPKMKKGGTFVGDDYCHSMAKPTRIRFKVIEAVDDFAKANNLGVADLPRDGWVIIKP